MQAELVKTRGYAYKHPLDGRSWLVKVYSVNPKDNDFGGRATFTGLLSGDQDGVKDKSPVWGYCSELNEAR